MRFGGNVLGTLVLGLTALTALPASGQTLSANMSPLQLAIACAPPPKLAPEPQDPIRVLGAQHAEPKTLLGEQDLLVLDGGFAKGLVVGQEFFVRRLNVDPGMYGVQVWPIITSGWVSIIAVNNTTAIANVLRTCGPIHAGDYIEPFVRPEPPANLESVVTSGRLDFTSLGRVLFGREAHDNASVGEFVLIDQGVDNGFAPGAPIALYRDPEQQGMPLVAIGEAAVVSVGPTMSLVRVNQARTEVRTGDYVVPRR
jgi:hypothetical protein